MTFVIDKLTNNLVMYLAGIIIIIQKRPFSADGASVLRSILLTFVSAPFSVCISDADYNHNGSGLTDPQLISADFETSLSASYFQHGFGLVRKHACKSIDVMCKTFCFVTIHSKEAQADS
jgi:hypothetical protein